MCASNEVGHPRVSVVIPTYNSGDSIGRALDSVLAQTYTDFEVIVVDDGSVDDTRTKLEPYLTHIRYVFQENRERSAARNRGIHLARGDYIAFLDSDDYWAPHKLQKQVDLLEREPQLGLVFSWAAAFNKDERVLRTLGVDFPLEGAAGMDAFEHLALHTSPPTLTVVARSECIQAAGLFDEKVSYIEDWDLWLRIALRAELGFVPEVLAYYQLSGNFKPALMAKKRVPETRPYVVKKVFALARTLPHRGDVLHLENKALARAYLESALIGYAVGNPDQARTDLHRAQTHDPLLFADGLDELTAIMANFALNLYDTWTPPKEAEAFLRTLFSNLPPSLQQLSRVRRATLRVAATGHGFRAWSQKEPRKASQMLLRAVLQYPEAALNRGIWSICWQSLVGEGVPGPVGTRGLLE